MTNQDDKQPEKREVIINIVGDSVEVSPDSQHASVFELVAVLNTVIGNFNVKQEEKK